MAITSVSVSTSGGGSATLGGESVGQINRTVQLTANPDSGFRFAYWRITRTEFVPAPVEAPVFVSAPIEEPAPVFSPVEPPVDIPPPVEPPVDTPPPMIGDPPIGDPPIANPPVEPPTSAPVEPPTPAPVEPPTPAPVEPPVAAPVFTLAPFTINLGQCGGLTYGACPPGFTCKGTFNSFQNGFTGTSTAMTFTCEPVSAPEAPVAAPEAAPQAPTTQFDINDEPPPPPTGGRADGGFTETNTQF